MDAFLLKDLCSADPFPGRSDLDEDTRFVDACLPIETNGVACLGNRPLCVKGKDRVHLCRDAPRDDFQDLAAEVDGQLFYEGRLALRFFPRLRGSKPERLVDQRTVLRLRRGLEQERWVGRRVLRFVLGDGINVAGVGDDDGVLLQRIEQRHGTSWLLGCDVVAKRLTKHSASAMKSRLGRWDGDPEPCRRVLGRHLPHVAQKEYRP